MKLLLVLCLVYLSLASLPFRAKRSTGCVDNGNIAAVWTSTLPLYSPDPADSSYRNYQITFNIMLAAQAQTGATVNAVMDVQPYGSYWPNLASLSFTTSDQQSYTSSVSGTAPTQPGVYHLQFTASINGVASRCFNITIEVTCSAAITNWCDGERRYIQTAVGAPGRCVRTYKPCGAEVAVGVPQTNLCYVYQCFPNNKSCGADPIGPDPAGNPCAICTANPEASCTPQCKNLDGSNRVCGDDTCGGVCGPNSQNTANGCPATGTNTLCGSTGTCVPTVPGACGSPYPLFGNSMGIGDPNLNPADQDGITYFNLNNVGETTDPVNKITASNRAQFGWPSDQLTVPITGARVRIFFNAAYYPDSVTPDGNSPNTPDVVFKFTIPQTTAVQSMEAYVLAQDGSVSSVDTFMVFLQEDCTDYTYQTPPITAPDVISSDDATPPGGFSSHIHVGQLKPGSYLIDPTLYSAINAGPLWLEVVFTDATNRNCPPICTGHLCGPNGCGGVCNVQSCQSPLTCNTKAGRCSSCPDPIPQNFVYNCTVVNFTSACLSISGVEVPGAPEGQTYTRQCGPDSDLCGGTCGNLNGGCSPGSVCQLETGLCVSVAPCDLFVPICTDPLPFTTGQYFCNTLCAWTELNAPLPDIVPDNQGTILSSMLYHWRDFDDTSCAFQEGCIDSIGWNLLLRFDTNIHNQGTITYWGASPFLRPDLLTYATCHQHYHENGFAYYYLGYVENGTIALESLKRSYCVETSGSSQTGPKNPCTSNTTCCSQGLEPGNFDSYNADLDCQWLSVSSLYNMNALGRWYLYTVSVNQHQAVPEYSTLNNRNSFYLYLPCPPDQEKVIIYQQYIQDNPEVCCGRPGGPDPVFCPGPTGGCSSYTYVPGCDATPPPVIASQASPLSVSILMVVFLSLLYFS